MLLYPTLALFLTKAVARGIYLLINSELEGGFYGKGLIYRKLHSEVLKSISFSFSGLLFSSASISSLSSRGALHFSVVPKEPHTFQ